jgi:predicted anti-sigma-YlaC factor YlaD
VSIDKDLHLDEDQLLWAVVEENELPLPLQEHLSACPQCRANKERFDQDLARLGQMAERLAPLPRGPVSLPVEKPRGSTGWLWGWRAYASATVAAALVVIVVWSSPMFRDTPGDNGDMLAREMQEAEQFMAEVSMLVENALPPVYLDISAESSAEFDDEFIQFVVPSVEEESLSYDPGKRGALLC